MSRSLFDDNQLQNPPAGGSSPAGASYITQTPDASLTNEQALSLLGTGLLKNTTGTGVLTIGVAGVDYAGAVHTHDGNAITSGTVAAAYGGTGLTGIVTGDVLIGTGVNTWSLLNAGTDGQVLTLSSGLPAWVDPASSGAPTTATYITQTPDGTLSAEQALSTLATGILKNTTGTGVLTIATAGVDYADVSHVHSGADITSGTVLAIYGGTGQTGFAVGDLLYADTPTTLTKLAAGALGQVLTMGASLPAWSAPTGGAATVTVSKNGTSVGTRPEINLIEGTNITLTLLDDGGNNRVDVTIDAAGGGGGAPTTATYITQTPDGTLSAEQALSTLSTGLMKNTTGTGVITIATAGVDYADASHVHSAADVTSGTLDETVGGTGQSVYTAGDLVYATSSTVLARLGIGSNGEFLQIVGGLPVWGSAPGGSVTGSGTTNQITYWDSSSSITSNSNFARTSSDALLLGGGDTITSSPTTPGSGEGWKLNLRSTTEAIGAANNQVAVKTGSWVSFYMFSSLPSDDASSTVPDTGADMSFGFPVSGQREIRLLSGNSLNINAKSLLVSGNDDITSAPDEDAATDAGWKIMLRGTTEGFGAASSQLVARTGAWFSIFTFGSNPADDAGSSTPDSNAHISFGFPTSGYKTIFLNGTDALEINASALVLNTNDAISGSPPAADTTDGWKNVYYSSTFATGVSQGQTLCQKFNNWYSLFDGFNPADDSTGSTPDTNAAFSFQSLRAIVHGGSLELEDQGTVKFFESSGTNYAEIQAPSSLAANWTLTLPSDNGDADQFLQTNGSGVTDWVYVSELTESGGTVRIEADGTGLGFFGATPIAKPSLIATLTDSSGGSTDGTVSAVSGTGDDSTVNDNFAELTSKVNAILMMLSDLGLHG